MDPPGQDRVGWAGQDPEKPSSLPAHFRFQLELHPVLDPCPRAPVPGPTVNRVRLRPLQPSTAPPSL
ncbi:uncharacterized protein K444DRAFT_621233 [Hyaloscypha bicolor E]|uniref:Uncharacterized protein n=1 Tax=Hyaloscypha bicolor E TaxID=1095630 RepID=A0A2J6SMU6_9HELO|nr:uncharacterized protein K444DRAFT_621233 [Hyaloscypha bicolor E]PMD52097.1 hypothetical protein K444DRAFT_621233 [Hyaloscypha bicolor E]